jgi:hypothetical protein
LNNKGKVIGGIWNTNPRTDFAWNVEISAFSGYMSIVKDIYLQSIGGNTRNTNLGKKNLKYIFKIGIIFFFGSLPNIKK